jgi:hypothetical protein
VTAAVDGWVARLCCEPLAGRRALLVSLALAVAAGACASGAPARDDPSAASDLGGPIAFESGNCRGGGCQIWVMDSDGTHPRRLTA